VALATSCGAPAADATKRVLEKPVKDALAGASAAAAGGTNPKVAPGKVRWHPDLTAARAAARASGKPVLLFQMMGRLDEHFC
jgi:hypothetical protein